jgi:hypothetical protein
MNTMMLRSLTSFSFFLLGFSCLSQVSGNVFHDFNFDGTKTTSTILTESGVKDVTVTAFDASGASTSVTTNSLGVYLFPNSGITASGNSIRLEFSNLPPFSHSGPSSGTTIRFVTAGSAANDINLGLIYSNDYCHSNNPLMVTPCYVESSDPNIDVVVRFSYNNTGTAPLDKTSISNYSQVGGSLWGLAYSRKDSLIYASAVLKTHVPLGPAGLDAIYSIDPFSGIPNATPWLQLKDDLGIDVSSVGANPQYATNIDRGVNTSPQNDAGAFVDVLKVGLGDIELSADEKTLYVVNLYDKKLYAINVATKSLSGTFTIPDPGCSNGQARPFAIGEYKGDIYVSVTCDGGSSGVPTNLSDNSGVNNLNATVYRLDGSSFTQVLNLPLNYPKEVPFQYTGGCDQLNRWKPWTDVLPATCADGNVGYPTPLVTDIEFSDNGDMILGFTDRTGFQIGQENYGPTGTTLYSLYAGGDILKACKTSTGWQIEDVAAGCKNTRGFAINTNDPTGYNNSTNNPKAGEFYEGDYFHNNGGIDNTGLSWFPGHPEIAVGALAVIPGTNEVMSTAYDPVTGDSNFSTGGVITLDNTSGKRPRNGFQLYNSTNSAGDGGITQGKGVGFGDLEVLCGPAPVEIGNRVWNDTDTDGIQDAGEAGIDGVTVKLFEGSTEVGSTTTTNGGQFYFTNTNVTGGVKYNTSYQVRIATSQTPLNTLSVTTVDANSNGSDLIDNDGTVSGANVIKAFSTGNPGENNHSYDFGFRTAPLCVDPAFAITQTAPTCNGGSTNNDGKITLTSATNIDKYGISTGATYTGAPYATATSLPTLPFDVQSSIPNAGATYTIRFFNGADVCFKDTTIIVAAVTCVCPPNTNDFCPGDSYTLDAGTGLTGIQWYKDGQPISGANNQTYIVTALGSYHFEATLVTNGCPANGCCPIVFVPGTCTLPCPIKVCLPVTITRN